MKQQKRYTDALQAYQQVVQIKPDDAFAYDQLGNALSELERYADAVKVYSLAIRHSPDFTRAHSSKAHALVKLGHYEQALAAYNKVLQLSRIASQRSSFLLFKNAYWGSVAVARKMEPVVPGFKSWNARSIFSARWLHLCHHCQLVF